jgi:deazaflavin-dependent oxidoreductase (nitroreductase family)
VSIQAPPEGTYGAKQPEGPKWLSGLVERMSTNMIHTYQRTGGKNWMLTMFKLPVVLLTTKGARTGVERTVAINGFPDGEDAWLVIASHAGSARHPAWFKNMVQHPDHVFFQVGDRTIKVRARTLDGHERDESFARIAKNRKQYAGYVKKTDRQIPVIRLTRVPQ